MGGNMRTLALAAASTVLLSACTSTLKVPRVAGTTGYYEVEAPKEVCPVAADATIGQIGSADSEGSTTLLQRAICRLRKKEYNTLRESQSFGNSGAWRNLPIIGGVAAIAGLVLFGERNAAGDLKPGENEAIQAIGLGAGVLTALNGYVNPANARKVLRQASYGYGCMAGHADLIVQEAPGMHAKAPLAEQLRRDLRALNREIAAGKFGGADLARAKEVSARAAKSLDSFTLQQRSLRTANTYLHNAEWSFGVDLLTRTDREDVDVDKLVAAIQQQQKSITGFEQLKTKPASTPAATGDAMFGMVVTGTQLIDAVELETDQLLAGLVNVDALVLGFDTCATAALAGSRPPLPRLASVKLD